MAYGVSPLQIVSRGQANKAAKVLNERDQKTQENVSECSPSNNTPLTETTASQNQFCDDCVLYSSEVEVPTSLAPEAEIEVEVESTENAFRRVSSPKLRRRGSFSQLSSHKISTINRRSRLWVKQMRRRRRRMSFFDGVRRYRLRYPLPERWSNISPISTRVDVKILKLLQNKRKQVKRDGLYQFVLWREALKAERNRLLGPKIVHG